MKFNQYEHKAHYGISVTAKLRGFVVVNEDNEDLLALVAYKGDSLITAYTENPKQALLFKTVEKAQAMIENIGKPLLVSAMYESKRQFFVACFMKYSPPLAS